MNVTPEVSQLINNLNAYIIKLNYLKDHIGALRIKHYDNYGCYGEKTFIPNPTFKVKTYAEGTFIPMGTSPQIDIENEFVPDDLKGEQFVQKCIDYCEQQIQILQEKIKAII